MKKWKKILIFSADIDTVIANSIFKLNDDKGRVNAMLGFIELKLVKIIRI